MSVDITSTGQNIAPTARGHLLMTGPQQAATFNFGIISVVVGLGVGALITLSGMPLEGGAIAVLGFAPLYLHLDRTCMPGLLIGPSIFLFVFHALGYALGPLAQRYFLGSERFIEDGMILAQRGAVLGLGTYSVVFPRVFQAAHRKAVGKSTQLEVVPRDHNWTGYTFLLLVTSFAILLYGYLTEGSRRIGGLPTDTAILVLTVISAFWYVQWIVFFFLGSLAAKHRGTWIVLWAACYVAYAAFTTLEGSRGPAVYALLLSAAGAVWGGASSRKMLLALWLSTLVFVPLAGIVDSYRSYTDYTSRYDEGFFARIDALNEANNELQSVSGGSSQDTSAAFIYSVSALTVDRVMVLTPDVIPYAGFENMDALLYIFIPKVFLPDRPELDDANRIAFSYGVGTGDNTSYVYIPAVGEGYRRFGWVGIPVIYAVSAVFFGLWTGVCWAKRAKREWIALMVFLVVQAPGVWSATFVSAVYFATFTMLKYYVFLVVLRVLQDSLALQQTARQSTGRQFRAPVEYKSIRSRKN